LTSAAATTRAKKPSGIGRTSAFSPGQRLADVGQQGRPVFTGCLAAQNDPAAAPVDVTQLQSRTSIERSPRRATSRVLITENAATLSRFAALEASRRRSRPRAGCAAPPRVSSVGSWRPAAPRAGWICANRDATYAVGLTVVRAGRCACCERSLSLRPMNSARRADRRGIRIPATMFLGGLQSGSRRIRVPGPGGEVIRR
jgi:hypothetical protein